MLSFRAFGEASLAWAWRGISTYFGEGGPLVFSVERWVT